MTQSQTVRVATCHDPAEAMLIGSVLAAHDIDASIPEGASLAGVAAAGFVTHVFVHVDDAEEAAMLIAELRAEPERGGEDDEDDGGDAGEVAAVPNLGVALDRRKRVGAVVMFALCVTFGTGHMAAGAWKRGFMLAAIELVGVRQLWAGNQLGTVLVVAAVLADVLGAVVRTRRMGATSTRLPVAQLRAPRSRAPR